jgi:acetylornithine deacetylase/succinyl-diaminopimelate desuccinylase-like protein
MTTSGWQGYLQEHQEQYLEELLTFLRIPSISSLPEHMVDVQRAAAWVMARLTQAGMEGARVLPTDGHPIVYAEHLHAPGKPTILIYGHFDTQPVDPLDLWTNPPFEPTVRDGRVYARGASDDKGNMLTPILAAEALLKTEGRLPVNVKWFFEGQEEIGSPDFPNFIKANRQILACDLVLSADGEQWSEDQPCITLGFRGLAGLQINVEGAYSDLHSGMYGGAVQNPIHALVQILDSMRGPDGRILVEGFYDDVTPLTAQDRIDIAQVPFDEGSYKDHLGVDNLYGETGYSSTERTWARPTLEVNGIWGGFQGEGIKTVLPNQAHAKVTCRLVPEQDPKKVVGLISAHVRINLLPGVRFSLLPFPGESRAYRIPSDHWGNRAASEVLTSIYGKPPFYTRSGGTIPVCELLLDALGAYTVDFAFGLDDEQFHAPNEFFRLSSFARGQEAYAQLLQRLGS